MLSLPNPETGATHNETYEGKPLVLMPDSAEDVASLLKALYDPTYVLSLFSSCSVFKSTRNRSLPFERWNPNTPLLVHGVLKMATKYQFDRLRERIVKHVESDWPTTLHAWDFRQAEIIRYQKDHPEPKEGEFTHEHFPEPVSAIRLAREFNIPTILPAAFYHLSTVPPENHWEGEAGQDEYWQRARWDLMQHGDFMNLLFFNTRVWLHSDLYHHIKASLDLCKSNCRPMFAKASINSLQDSPCDSLLFATINYSSSRLRAFKLCHNCIEAVEREVEENRGELWINMMEACSNMVGSG
jgi:hypothetical protein